MKIKAAERHQLFWRPSERDDWKFQGYHDGPHPTAKWDTKLMSWTSEGSEPPPVTWHKDGVPFDQMTPAGSGPGLRRLRASAGAEETRAAVLADQESARRAESSRADSLPRLSTVSTDAIIRVIGRHGRKQGTGKWQRAEMVKRHDGQTVAAFGAAGGNLETLRRGVKEGWVELEERK